MSQVDASNTVLTARIKSSSFFRLGASFGGEGFQIRGQSYQELCIQGKVYCSKSRVQNGLHPYHDPYRVFVPDNDVDSVVKQSDSRASHFSPRESDVGQSKVDTGTEGAVEDLLKKQDSTKGQWKKEMHQVAPKSNLNALSCLGAYSSRKGVQNRVLE